MALTTVQESQIDPSFSGFLRNRIINGDMRIDQRNAGASVTQGTSVAYTVDRFYCQGAVTSKFTVQQNAGSVTPPAGFTNYLGVTSSAATTVGTSDAYFIRHVVEGYNVADLAWGTANAQSVTISFWVRSSLTGTFGLSFINSAASRAYPATYTINAANTWEQKTITISGDTTGTWVTNNGAGLNVTFGLGYGSSLSGTANAWNAGTAFMPTGAVSVVGTNTATWYLTGVQLEVGTVATPFERRQFGQEVVLCQRYFSKSYNLDVAPGTITGVGATGGISSSTSYQAPIFLPVQMRTTPTGVAYNSSTGATGTWRDSSAADRAVTVANGASTLVVTCTTNGSNAFYNGQWTASAEL